MTKGSTLNRIVDAIITEQLGDDEGATQEGVEIAVRERHADILEEEGARLVARGLKDTVASRLRALAKDPDANAEDGAETAEQLRLDLPDDLSAVIGRIITVRNKAGHIAHKSLSNPRTTVGDLKSHRAICAENVGACNLRLAAVNDAIDRCGGADNETPLVDVLGRRE